MLNNLPPEMIRRICGFLEWKCYACLRSFSTFEDIPITHVYQHQYKRKLIHFCDKKCEEYM